MNYSGIYIGRVTNNAKDPLIRDGVGPGRVQVRVPHVYGSANETEGVPDDALPWAIPFGTPNGGTPASGGVSWVPKAGDQVLVMFLDGDPEQPVYAHAMQPLESAAANPVFRYDSKKVPIKEKVETAYGHRTTLSPGGIDLNASSSGVVLVDDPESLPPLPPLPPGTAPSMPVNGESLHAVKNPSLSVTTVLAAYNLSVNPPNDDDYGVTLPITDASSVLEAKFAGTKNDLSPYPKTISDFEAHQRRAELTQQYRELSVRVSNADVTPVDLPLLHVNDHPSGNVGGTPAVQKFLSVPTHDPVTGADAHSDPQVGFAAEIFYKKPAPDTRPSARSRR